MNIERELKKSGITVISELDSESKYSIAEYVANGICDTFPKQHFTYEDLRDEINSIPMYIASLPNGLAEASYFYKNSGIYFRDGMGLSNFKKYAIHEIIHHLQEIKDEKNNLLRMGLCTFNSFKSNGMALNEAAVQTLSTYIEGSKLETVTYYGIEFPTISPDFYPLICNLLSQMCYITGEDILYDSVFNSNDNFKNKFIEQCDEKSFYTIQKNLDLLLQYEEQIIILVNKYEDINCTKDNALKYQQKVNILKDKIRNTFLETQQIIFTSYFDNQYYKLKSDIDIEIYKKRFTIYKELIGITDSYSKFSTYYADKMDKLDSEYNQIISNKFLAPKKKNRFLDFLQSLLKKNT